MEKIFDREFREALIENLKEAGVEEKEADNIVITKYHNSLKRKAATLLRIYAKALEEENFDLIPTKWSPAGDCIGCDNSYIDFTETCNLEDIGDIIDELRSK